MKNILRSSIALGLFALCTTVLFAGNGPSPAAKTSVLRAPTMAPAALPQLAESQLYVQPIAPALAVESRPTLAPNATAQHQSEPVQRTSVVRQKLNKLKTLATAMRSIRMAQRATAGMEHTDAQMEGGVFLVILIIVLLLLLLGYFLELAAFLLYILLIVLLVLLILWLVALI